MSTQVQFRRGTATQNNSFTGALGEITIDTDNKSLRIHDGTTPGGSAVPTLNGTQTFTNKTFGSGSTWNGNSIGVGYGGTGASLTATAGAIVYSGASTFGLTSAGTSGQVLSSAGSSAPVWLSQSALTVGNATQATNATNLSGGSAGQLAYQTATNTTGFITAGASGTFLQSTGAGTTPTWAAGQVTYGSTTVGLGSTSTSLQGLTLIDTTTGATSVFPSTVAPVLFGSSQNITIGNNTYGSISSSTTFTFPTGTAVTSAGTYSGVSVASTSGSGSGATFNVVKSGSGTYYAANFVGGNATISNLQAQSGSGPWTATLSGLTSTAGFVVGAPITATNGTGTLAGGSPTSVVVASIVSGTSITYTQTGGTTPIVGTVTAVTQTGNTTITYNSGSVGSGYAIGDSITIAGASLGGSTPTNNLTFNLATAIQPIYGTVNLNAATVTTANTTFTFANTTATTVNAFGAATTLNIGGAASTFYLGQNTGNTTVSVLGNGSTGTATVTTNVTTGTINLFTGGQAISLGANSGTLTVGNPTVVGTQTTQNLFNTVATTVNAFGSAATIALGATSGTLTINNPTVVGSQTTVNLWNTTSTTVNAFGAATTISIGSTSGTTTVNNNLTITGNLTVNGTTTTVNQETLNTSVVAAQGVEISGSYTGSYSDGILLDYVTGNGRISVGSADGITLYNNTNVSRYQLAAFDSSGNMTLTGATLVGLGTTQNIFNTTATTVNAFGAATTISLGASTGTTTVNNALYVTGHVKLEGVTSTGATGTGNIVFASSPSLTSPSFSTIVNSGTLTLPTSSDTLVGRATTDTLTNKTLSSAVITGTLTAGASAGTSGQILQSTGTGVQWASATISLAGTSGSGSVSTGGTLTIAGTTNQITSTVSSSTVTLSLPQSINTGASVQFGSFGVGTAASGTTGEIRATATITSYYSDERLKTRSGNIENALAKVLSLDGFHYTANETAQALGYDGTKQEVGLSAQQVQAVLPEVVVPAPIDAQYLTIHYDRVIPLLVEAIKEQQNQIQELKELVARLGK